MGLWINPAAMTALSITEASFNPKETYFFILQNEQFQQEQKKKRQDLRTCLYCLVQLQQCV